jgi:hypothetical protein
MTFIVRHGAATGLPTFFVIDKARFNERASPLLAHNN